VKTSPKLTKFDHPNIVLIVTFSGTYALEIVDVCFISTVI
jgi:hypothetical protein